MDSQAACAHLRVSRRKEEVDGRIREWWECDFNCGCKFAALLPPASKPANLGIPKIADAPDTRHAKFLGAVCDTTARTEDMPSPASDVAAPKPAPPAKLNPMELEEALHGYDSGNTTRT